MTPRNRDLKRSSRMLAGADGIDQGTWDAMLSALGGHLMQSWQWGEFQRHDGNHIERISITGPNGTAMAQVVLRPRGPLTTASIPRGPVITGDREAVAEELLAAIDSACQRHRALLVAIEASEPLPLTEVPERFGFISCRTRYTPGRTVIVPLLDDDPLLAQMNPGTRNRVRRAQRHGVHIRKVAPDESSMGQFYTLLEETAKRHGFRIDPLPHYLAAVRLFGDDAALFFAAAGEVDVAVLIVARFGEEAIYLFGASVTEMPIPGATALLQFEAMRWARSRGCRRYDLWGIEASPVGSEDDGIDRRTSRECADDNGLCRFKMGFGGNVAVLPRRIERHYHPHLVGILRRYRHLRGSKKLD